MSLRPTALLAGLAVLATSTAGVLSPVLVAPAHAADSSLIADFSFDDAATGFSGAGATATRMGTPTLVASHDGGQAVRLQGGAWLDVKKDDGAPLLAGLDDVTISYDSRPDAGSANAGWAVSAQRTAAQHSYPNEHYLGTLDKTDSLVVERYDNAGSRDTSGNLAAPAAGLPSGWKHVDIVLKGTTGALYVDGRLVASNDRGKLLSGILGSTGGVLQLGKASWGGGEYFTGLLDDVEVRNRALSAREVAEGAGEWVARALQRNGLTLAARTVRLPSYDGAVTWSAPAGSRVRIDADGRTATVDLPSEAEGDATVELTASVGGASTTVTATVEAVDLDAALAIPARVASDLPSTVLGRTVTWDDGRGGQVVSPSGAVSRPAAGAAPVSVRLTATIQGEAAPLVADVTVLDLGGEVASYVKQVTTRDGVKDDPLAYDEDRRADALFVASRAAGAGAWEPLNRAQAILDVDWDGSQTQNPHSQMGSPTFFRHADGTLGVVASQDDATGSVYVWDSTDGATFTGQRLVAVAPGAVVRHPRIVFDAVTRGYRVFWTDADGAGRVTALPDLAAGRTPPASSPADAVAMGVSGTGLPAYADQTQASSFAMSSRELDAFHRYYVDLQNTGVRELPVTRVQRGAGLSAEQLPARATMEYNDGSTKSLPVTWDAADLARVGAAEPGTYTVSGTVQQGPTAMVSDARADPHVFHNEVDGYWYLTGSHYGQPSDAPMDLATSYRKIGLKRSKTLAGLATAPESIVVDPDAGTPGRTAEYPNTFFGWSGWIWAQEFHRINGTWWILAAMNRDGYEPNAYAWPDRMVLIPYTGTDASIVAGGMLEAANWGRPVELENSPGFDVSYYERTEGGSAQGYYVIPKGNSIRIAKAVMGPKGTVPQFDGAESVVYSFSRPWEAGKQAPTPSDTTEGADQPVVEGPYLFEHGDHVYLTYSGGTVDKFYSTGMLRADRGADLTKAASWTPVDFPVLSTYDTYRGRIGGVPQAGTGHNSLAVDEAGNVVLAYHARPYPEPHPGNDAGGLIDQDRSSWIKPVSVRANGNLDLTLTPDQEVAPAHRTVRATVVVAASDAPSQPSQPSQPTQPTTAVPPVKAAPTGLAVKARASRAGRPLVVRVAVGRLTNGATATGTVTVRVKGAKRVLVATLRDGSVKVRVPARLLTRARAKLTVTYVPADPATTDGATRTVTVRRR